MLKSALSKSKLIMAIKVKIKIETTQQKERMYELDSYEK